MLCHLEIVVSEDAQEEEVVPNMLENISYLCSRAQSASLVCVTLYSEIESELLWFDSNTSDNVVRVEVSDKSLKSRTHFHTKIRDGCNKQISNKISRRYSHFE